jgi:glycosyltransferase involved in cell wall biosynthesis
VTGVLHVAKVAGVAGAETHLLSLLPALRERGWDARMIVLHEGEPAVAEFVDGLRAAGVPVEPWRMHVDFDPRVTARLALRRPDILHTHLFHADVLGLPAGAIARVPVRISTKHGFNEFRSRRPIAAADRFAARFAHRQIAISNGLADYLVATEGFARDDFAVVHYGIAAGPEPPPLPEPTRLAAVGRLIPIKGFDVLLRAFAAAREEVAGLTLELAGWGPEADALRALAPDGVVFPGRVAPATEVYERAAIVVVPSRGEGFGMVALEAQERGRPAIVSAVGGLPEIVADGETGVVVPVDDPRALAAAIVELTRDPERLGALGAAARRRALAQFSPEATVEATERVYRHLLARRSIAAPASSASTKSNEMR